MDNKCFICGSVIQDDEPCEECINNLENELLINKDLEDTLDDFSAEDYGEISEDGNEYEY